MITALCLFMILVEVYHFLCHNKVHLVAKTFFDRMTFFSRISKMMNDYYAAKRFGEEHPSNKLIAEFMEKYGFHMKCLESTFKEMPSAVEMTYDMLSRLKPKAIRTIIVYCVIELAYFAAFIWLTFLLPVTIAPTFCFFVLVMSGIHAWNERGEQLKWVYWPMIDATVCICIYTYVLIMFGGGLS